MKLPATLVAALACSTAAGAQTRLWRPEERAIVSDFTVVYAVAASEQRVFVAAPGGLGIYDRRFRRWEPPVSTADGYPPARVLAALADPADESVWLGTTVGLVQFRPLIRRFDVVNVPGGVRSLAYDRDDPFRGVFLLTASGWQFLARGSFFPTAGRPPPPPRRVAPLTVDEVFSRQPVVDAMRGEVLTDDRLRTFRYTGAAAVPLTEEYYLGTDGLGLIHLDVLVARFERMPFGLLAPGVGALLPVPGGVWAGTDARSRRPGLTFVADDLQEYRYQEGPRAAGLPISGVRALLGRGDRIWAATDQGVFQFAADGDTRQLRTSQGLPDNQTYALAQGPSGVWVGTALGLAFVRDDGTVSRIGEGPPVPVLALSAARDTVWVGTTSGLGFATPTDGIFAPPALESAPELQSAVVAVAHAGDTVVAALVDGLVWRAPGERWHVERVVERDLGAIFTIAPGEGGVWLGGERGIAFFRFAERDYRFYPAPGDVPGPVLDLVVSGRHLWVGTERGLVRFAREALRP